MNVIDKGPADVAPDQRIGLVVARFNEMVVSRLVEGARAALTKYGVPDDAVTLIWVPGCFELPAVAARVAPHVDAVVCLGAVIRGETPHFDYVASESARGIREVSMQTAKPIIFGVLTTDSLEQALDRAGGSHGNKGWDCIEAALEMCAVYAAVEETT